jgi:hypothetical protein
MPSSDGTALDPGREREREKKRDEGAKLAGVMPRSFEENGAPSRLLPFTGVMECAMRESRGSARPRTPLNSYSRGSESTLVAAAVEKDGSRKRGESDRRCAPRAWLLIVYPPT